MNDDWSEGRLTAATRDDPWRKAGGQSRAACRATRPDGYVGARTPGRFDEDDLVDHRPSNAGRSCAEPGRIAIAVATKFFAVGARVPNIEPRARCARRR